MLVTRGEAIDAWIMAIPDEPYDLCPCGCGMKWKFANQEGEKHEAKFIADRLAEHEGNDRCD